MTVRGTNCSIQQFNTTKRMKNLTSPHASTVSRLRRRRAWAALGFGLTGMLLQTLQAQYALPVYEPFPASYTNGGAAITVNGVDWPGNGLRQSGIPSTAVWTWGGAGVGNPTNTGPAALSYPGLYQTNGSVGLFMQSIHVTGNRNAGIQIATVNSGTLYTSFLLNVQTWPTNQNRMVCQLNSLATTLGGSELVTFFLSTTNTTTGTSNRLYVVKHSSNVTNEPPAEAPSIDAGTTHLVVMRYTFNPAQTNDDELAMWVDPGSLGAPEGGVPAPAQTITTNTDVPSFSTFAICAQNDTAIAGSGVFIDEIRIGTSWADVTPTGPPCNRAFISVNPTNVSVVEGGMATFTTVGGGSDATFQWQMSTDAGAHWAALTRGFGTNTPSLSIPSATSDLNGSQFRCQIVATGCGNSTTNSTAATLTVTAPVVTPPGVLVDDFFMKRDRLSGPVNATNSIWLTDITASLYENADPDPFMLVGKPQDATSCVWLGYCTESNFPPVHLEVGRVLQATLVFTCQGIQTATGSGLRLGLFDHYDAGLRLAADGATVKNSGVNVRGYMFYQNWDTAFSDDEPQTIYARNNMADPSLMGTTGDYVTLAHSAAGFLNAPAFSDGTTYTLDLYVARMTTGRCSVTMNVTGGGTNYTTTAADRDFGYHRFDCIAVRPNNQQTTANEFDISEFKLQVLQMPARPTLNIAKSGASVVLSWTNPALYAPFRLEQAPTMTGPWSFVTGGAASPYTTGATNTATFFRLEWP
jgi:hypothetical protein